MPLKNSFGLPGFQEASARSNRILTSPSTGTVIVASQRSKDETYFEMVFPRFDGHAELREDFNHVDDVKEAYATQWIRWAAVTIGTGFHPDTPAQDYEPALEVALAAEYDEMIGLCFEVIDPYEESIAAWQDAHLMERPTNH